MSQPLRADVLLALAHQRWKGEDPEPTLRNLLADIDKARGKRNNLIHGLWKTDRLGKPSGVEVTKARRKFETKFYPMSVSDISNLADEAVRLRFRMFRFVLDHLV